ncbi:hypothetical protein VHUM_02088 [Vanrija humicola]|uniref:MPN domain-containing protein n=1 Tax=Vanrija humicola TaxID=5417 RepID=A0A7D8Z604_VANHU|nr:hypothetical protein VHUM_02088 [Vanrija humicola]
MAPTLSAAAYAVPLLHAAAHPSSTVSGLLLGPSAGEVTDAVPLVHRYGSLSPTTELGIDLVTAHASTRGLKVVGFYEAREGGETALSRWGEKAASAVGGLWLVVCCSGCRRVGLAAHDTPQASTDVTFPPETVRAGALTLIRRDRAHASLRDLDDHLDDARVEWLENKAVKAAIAKLQ